MNTKSSRELMHSLMTCVINVLLPLIGTDKERPLAKQQEQLAIWIDRRTGLSFGNQVHFNFLCMTAYEAIIVFGINLEELRQAIIEWVEKENPIILFGYDTCVDLEDIGGAEILAQKVVAFCDME